MYAVIQRILAQLPAIKQVFADDKSHWPLPSWTSQNIAVLEVDQNGLIPVLEFTNILSAETYVTVSSLLPMKDILKEEETDVKTAEKRHPGETWLKIVLTEPFSWCTKLPSLTLAIRGTTSRPFTLMWAKVSVRLRWCHIGKRKPINQYVSEWTRRRRRGKTCQQ